MKCHLFQVVSLPVILTSQTSQEIMAKGTLIWDAAFSEQVFGCGSILLLTKITIAYVNYTATAVSTVMFLLFYDSLRIKNIMFVVQYFGSLILIFPFKSLFSGHLE